MPRPRVKTINNYFQVAVFPNDFFITDINALYAKLITLPEFVDGNNIVFPIPPDAPREIPRIVLQTKNAAMKLEISFTKILITWNNDIENIDDEESFDKNVETIQRVSSTYLSKILSVKSFSRVGLIKQFFFVNEGTVSEPLNQNLINIESSTNLNAYEFRLSYKTSLDIYTDVNELIVITDGYRIKRPEEKIVLVSSDINTPDSKNVSFDLKNLQSFIEQAYKKQQNDNLYKRFFE